MRWISGQLLATSARAFCLICQRPLFAKKVGGEIYHACRQCDGLTTIPEVA